MKAEIKKNGMLEITAETELESFALGHWYESNVLGNDTNGQMVIGNGKLLFDWTLESTRASG